MCWGKIEDSDVMGKISGDKGKEGKKEEEEEEKIS